MQPPSYDEIAQRDEQVMTLAHEMFTRFVQEGEAIAARNPNVYYWLAKFSHDAHEFFEGEQKFERWKAEKQW